MQLRSGSKGGRALKARFLGGGNEVGRLGMILSTGRYQFLFDYGMNPTKPPSFPMLSPRVDAVFVTHSHLDHVGMLPWINKVGGANIYATPPTLSVIPILLYDAVKIANIENNKLPYEEEDVDSIIESFTPINYGETLEFKDHEISAHSTGHLIGSSMYLIENERRILFTGDVQSIDTHLLFGIRPVDTDILIVESTYAGKEHPPRRSVEENFISSIDKIVEGGGVAVIPAFATGRAQELLMVLENTDYEIWLDGMARTVSNVLLSFPKYIKNYQRYRKMLRRVRVVRSKSDRDKALKGDVIITTSGMLDGGPVLNYISQLNEQKNGLFLTGYQVEDTNGRMLLETGSIDLAGVITKVNMDVKFFDFSAHSGHKELVEFIEGCRPDQVVLMHGEKREEQPLEQAPTGRRRW
ncbi:MAG: MBL fold metallo-hydrolase [Thermoplasmatales archaeon]